MKPLNILKTIFCFVSISLPALSAAEKLGPFTIAKSKPVNEVWLNPGFFSYHFETDKKLNGNNYGLGFEYRYTTVNAIVAGVFRNSDKDTSHYVGWTWQPLRIGRVRFGAEAGLIDGYRKMHDGDWFPAVAPFASFEYKSVGANLIFIPSYKDKLYGALSLQLKMKLDVNVY